MGVFDQIVQTLTKCADFTGRASRSEFWIFFLFMLLAQAAARLSDVMLTGGSYLAGPVATLAGLFLFVPLASLTVRRLHDVDRSGRLLLMPCLLLLASPLILLFGGSFGRIVALGYAAALVLVFGQLLLVLARTGSLVANRYGACPTAFWFGR